MGTTTAAPATTMDTARRTARWRRAYRAVADYLAAAPGTHILL
jgi:hypothetical protein